MTGIKVLVEGYVRKGDGILFASPTTIFVKNNGLNIIIDPGSNKELFLKALKNEGLNTKDIDIIFLTHHHLDHILNIRLFPDKKVLDGNFINDNDRIISYSGNIPGTDLKVLYTPGHTYEHWSIILQTEKARYAIAGDVFWWNEWEKQEKDMDMLIKHPDTYAYDNEALQESRRMLIEEADFIIPGHGKIFSTSM